MAFQTCSNARKFMIRMGIGAAPFVVAWHECPKSEESPLAPPPEHIAQEVYEPVETNGIEMFTSAPSSMTTNLAVRVGAEHVRIGNQLFKIFRNE